MTSRIAFIATVVSAIASLAATASAELSRSDQAALLWSTRLQFDANHVPIVPIAILDDVDAIQMSSPSGFYVELDADGATSIDLPEAKSLTARVLDGQPAVFTYYAAMATVPGTDLAALQQVQKVWKDRHFQTIAFELGSVFGFFGRVMDSRAFLIAIDQPHANRKAAEETAAAIRAAYPDVAPDIHAVVAQRPSGRVQLHVGKTVITALDMARLRSRDGSPLRVHDVVHGKGFAWEKRADRDYHGEVLIAPDRSGKVAAVNAVDAETLLRGLVPSEIYPSSPADALRAQSIVARGELLAKLGHRHLTDPYVVCSDVHCQVYKGAGQEDPRTDAAIRDTQGLMLFDAAGLVDAVYSANCGGHSESNEHAWGQEPKASLRGIWDRPEGGEGALSSDGAVDQFLQGATNSFCATSSKGSANFRWTITLTPEGIAKSLGEDRQVGRPLALEPLARGDSGRITQLRVRGSERSLELAGELVIRRALGGLKSSLFVVHPEGNATQPDRFVLVGGGFGHGVGLCQTGAIGAAEKGWDYPHILQHYYRGSAVERVY